MRNVNIVSLYLNIGGTNIMKILRAIGAFFVKIGRWIANTAWIQPLLIVGGIFAVIFSIPYIKTAIENAQIDNTDYDYEYYKSKALGLEENGRAQKLFDYLDEEDFTNINNEFGKKFFVTFAKEDCAYCKECVAGFKNLEGNFGSLVGEGEFKMYTIIVDETDDDGNYLAKNIINDHEFISRLAAYFSEVAVTGNEEYAIYKNVSSQADTLKSKLNKLPESTDTAGEGFDTPFTFLYDYDQRDNVPSEAGVTAFFFNYVDLMTDYSQTNEVTKGFFLRDCWKYEKVFDKNYLNNK